MSCSASSTEETEETRKSSRASRSRARPHRGHGCDGLFESRGGLFESPASCWSASRTSASPLRAGDEFQDANNASFDESVVSLDNTLDGQTNFPISTNRTTIGWQDLQQPGGNTLDFHFESATDASTVVNYIGAQHPSHLNGTVLSNGTVAFVNPYGVFIGENAVIDVGSLVAIAGDVSRDAFTAQQELRSSSTAPSATTARSAPRTSSRCSVVRW